ncbi:MAG TPA: hypothetical protein VMV72_20005 [Verrucomicrobiae bacterium]|nr:hypothetical protein [Verrucomicrobiae bacterium]
MKRQLIIGCVAATLVSACATHQWRNELPSSSPLAARIQNALNQTVISQVEIQNLTLEKTMKMWQKLSVGSHHQAFDFHYVISHPVSYTSQPIQQSGAQGAPAVSTLGSVRITILRKNITSARLLDEICGQANYSWIIMGREIVLRPGTASTAATQP